MITDERIERLRDAAGEAGDTEMVAICEIAIYGYPSIPTNRLLTGAEKDRIDRNCPTQGAARSECERVITEADAQA